MLFRSKISNNMSILRNIKDEIHRLDNACLYGSTTDKPKRTIVHAINTIPLDSTFGEPSYNNYVNGNDSEKKLLKWLYLFYYQYKRSLDIDNLPLGIVKSLLFEIRDEGVLPVKEGQESAKYRDIKDCEKQLGGRRIKEMMKRYFRQNGGDRHRIGRYVGYKQENTIRIVKDRL